MWRVYACQGLESNERMPQFSESFFRSSDEVSRDITVGTYAADVAGLRQEGVSTVGQQTILSRAAHQKFTAANEQMNPFGSILGGRYGWGTCCHGGTEWTASRWRGAGSRPPTSRATTTCT